MFSEKISCASTQHSMSYKPRDGRRSTSARLRGLPMDIASALARWRILFTMIREKKNIEIVDIFMKKGDQDYRKRRRLIQ